MVLPGVLLVLAAVLPLRALPAHAAGAVYYFHGKATDQVNKATPPGTATFNQTAPTGTAPVTQTASPVANQAVPENPLAAYWKGSFTGTLSGDLQLDWWWSSPNPTSVAFGLGMDVTVFADVNDSTQTGTVAGNAFVSLQVGATPTENKSLIPLNGTVATSNLVIQATPHFIDTGEAPVVYYDATSTPSSFTFVTPPAPPVVTFDTTTKVAFAPASIVSPSFLGGEPETTMERQIAGSQPGRVDNQRVFIDWPLSSRSQTGQLSRSLNGGDSFRMLLDLTVCPERDRPNCATGGGGDTKSEVNLYDGTLYFADQEVLVNEAGASSTDHGDTWPLTRQWPVTNTATGVDRQWLAYIDPTIANVGGNDAVEAFLTYHVPAGGEYIQGIDQNGTPIAQPSPQIPLVNQSGTARVDNSSGPAHGWIYQPYRGGSGVMVGTAYAGGNPVPGYISPTNWHPANVVNGDTAVIFPWLQIDGHGNAYVVWVNSADGRLYLSVSPIDDARNNPRAPGGWPGTYWTPKADITPAGVVSTVFPEVTAGDPGRIAVAFMGSTDCNPTPPASNKSDNCSDTAHWNTYVDFIPDALALVRGAPVSVASGIVSHRVDHRGSICTSGTTCTGDRSLLDMIDLGFDSDGRVGVVFTDNNNQLAAGPTHTATSKNGPFTHYAKETQGPSLLASKPPINLTIPLNSRASAAGDATWPNTAAGHNLPSLDILGTSIGLSADGSQLAAKVRLGDTTLAGMQRDLDAYNASTTEKGARLQYTVRFSTGEDIYHLDMDFSSGAVRFFGGLVDQDDAVYNVPIPSSPPAAVVGARYVKDSGFTVTGSLRNGVLTLMAPKAQFGVDTGTSLFSVASFAMAGPTESDPTANSIENSMRTVDAGFPFDAQLATVQSPPGPVKCGDNSIREHGDWHDVDESGASGGHICRDVGHHDTGSGSSGSDMQVDFYGSGADVLIARGPRGGNFTMAIDNGAPVNVDEYRAPKDPAHPDATGRMDLDLDVPVHIDAPSVGYHTLKIHVVNNSTDPLRNMVYVDGFAFYGGDGVGPPTTANDVSSLINGTVAAALTVTYPVLVTANAVDLNFILEAVPGTTLTVKDPAGNVVASGTVSDGVLAIGFGPHSIGAYTVDVRNTTAGQIAFDLWETVGGA